MSQRCSSDSKDAKAASGDFPPGAAAGVDLSALPAPRRPWRTTSLLTLGSAGLGSLIACFALSGAVSYGLSYGGPRAAGELATLRLAQTEPNSWVRASGTLDTAHPARYRRPLDPDRFLLARAEGRDDLWVEVREPLLDKKTPFIFPTSFVGRLVPLESAGPKYWSLRGTLLASGQPVPSTDAWLLIDGDPPSSNRWVVGAQAMLLAFLVFSFWGLKTLFVPHARGG